MLNNNILISDEEINRQKKFINAVYAVNISPFSEKNKNACVMTFGCQQNEADSERIEGILNSMGYNVVESERKSECAVIIVNTCAIREHAELKAFSKTGQLKNLKEKNRDIIIGMCGCMVEQEHQIEKVKKSYSYVDFIFGTHAVYKFPEILFNVLNSHGEKNKSKNKKLNKFEIEQNKIAEGLPVLRLNRHKANISVMYGCNNFCSYCVVPYVRGRERSRNKDVILDEIKKLADDGCKEFTLLGQNVNSYDSINGVGSGKYRFTDLLSDILKINGDYIIRFMTSHPKDASDELIDIIKSDTRIARHFHLPLQSGNDRILKLMNRHYTKESYLELCERIKKSVPDISVTSDIIVAFPTETDEEFLDTLDVVNKVKFDNIYPFIYSKRKNTPAEKMECTIPKEEKNRRFDILLERQNAISLESNINCINKTFRVFVDGVSKNNKEFLTGRTSQNKLVHFKHNCGLNSSNDVNKLTGNFANIKITEAKLHTLYGEKISDLI